MRISPFVFILGALCLLIDALFPGIAAAPAVQHAELATLATIATILGGLSTAASPLLAPDPVKQAGGGQGPGTQIGAFQGTLPSLNASQGAPAAMQAYLTQLAGAQRGGASPSMRQRPRAASPMQASPMGGAPGGGGAQPSGVGSGVPKNGMPGMSDLAGMLQSLYQNMAGG